MDLPVIRVENFPDARVAFIVTLFRSLMCNQFLLEQHSVKGDTFRQLRDKLSANDYRTMQELEAALMLCCGRGATLWCRNPLLSSNTFTYGCMKIEKLVTNAPVI